MKRLTGILFTVLALAGCREDPGAADYSSHVDLRARNEPPPFLLGPTPFMAGVPRLAFGASYEGEFTEQVVIDGVTAFFFIFDTANDGTGQLTFTTETASDRVEGSVSDRIIHAGTGFIGGGVFWYIARDISQYSTLNLSLKSSDPAFAELFISVSSGPDRPADGMNDAAQTFMVNATSYGYANDGEWHSLTIPFSDLEQLGWDPSSVRSPFAFSGGGAASGENFLIDDVYIQ